MLSIQNGLGGPESAAEVLGRERVMSSLVGGFGASMRCAVHAHHNGMELVRLGEFGGPITARLKEVEETWRRAGFRVKIFDDIDQLVWEKLVCNCSLSGPCAVSDMTTGELMADPDMARISAACATEAFDVARQKGVKLGFADRWPTRAISPRRSAAPLGVLLDLMDGRKSEIDVINGSIPGVEASRTHRAGERGDHGARARQGTSPQVLVLNEAEMREWRRDIHAHPELGFQEERTSDLVASRLESFGIEVHRGIGRTGVVGVLRNGNSSGSVGLRADMDALPIQEANTFAHRSRHEGRMHACGHDGHTAMLLGAAPHLAATRNFDGTVHFIFQPAEEGIGGARAMVDDGLFRRFPCHSLFGMHNRPGMPLGRFAVRSGAMMAGGAFFDIDVAGRGAHGARPESGVDPVLAAAHIATALQSIVSRNVRPVETAVVSVTQIHAGDAYNVIPQSARLSGTVRAFSNEVMELIGRNLARIAEGWAAGFGATARPISASSSRRS